MEHRQYAILRLARFTEPLPDNESMLMGMARLKPVV